MSKEKPYPRSFKEGVLLLKPRLLRTARFAVILAVVLAAVIPAGCYADQPDRAEACPPAVFSGMERYPAQEFTQTTSDGGTVSVSAPEGAFPSGTGMRVEKVCPGSFGMLPEDAEASLDNAWGVDITFTCDGKEIQPRKEIGVRIGYPELKGSAFRVYHVADDGKTERVEAAATAGNAAFFADRFSVYIVGGVAPEDDSTVISVAYNFYNKRNLHILETEVIEYELKAGEPSVSTSYAVPAVSGKTAALRADSHADFTLSGGAVTATLDGSETQYVVNVEYSAKPAQYTVKYLFQTADGSKYVEDSAHPSETLDGETGDLTAVKAASVEGFFAQPVAQQIIKEDGSTVVEVRYDRADVILTYNTNGGSYISTVHGRSGSEFTVHYQNGYELTCTKTEHVCDAKPSTTAKRGATSANGCWVAQLVSGRWQWVKVCTIEEHKHTTESCYQPMIYPHPAKAGYWFNGWFLDANCTEPAPEKMTLTESTTVYAKWTVKNVPYAIVIQKENIDGRYDYVETIGGRTASAGTIVSITSDPGFSFTDSKYYHFAEGTSAVVKADGSTVVYAKYDLNEYTLDFTLYPKPGTSTPEPDENVHFTMNGTDYYKDTTPHYSFVCKLGQDISAQWPTKADFSGESDTISFHGWVLDTTPFASKRVELTTDMLMNTEDGSTSYYYADLKKRNFPVELHYWLENVEDNDYSDSPVFRQDATTDNGWTAKQIAGFTHEKTKEIKNEKYEFFYKRNTYSLEYYHNADLIRKISGIKFEKDIKGEEYDYVPETPSDMKGYTFGGWYSDPECSGDPYSFEKMPASNQILYSKWLLPVYQLRIDYGHDDIVDEFAVEMGSIPQEYIGPAEREGYEFLGWYTQPEGGTLYDTSEPINCNTTIYAHYKRLEKTRYSVQYVNNNGDPILAPVVYDATADELVREEAPVPGGAYADFYVDEEVKFLTVSSVEAENVITFVYADPSTVNYFVEYVLPDGSYAKDGEPRAFRADAKEKIVKADKAILNSNPGHRFEKGSKWLRVSSDETRNVVTYLLIPGGNTIAYRNVDPAWAKKQPGVYTMEDTVAFNRPGEENGNTFIGWDFTTKGGVCQTADHSHYNTVLSPGSYGAHTFTALWAKLSATDAKYVYDGKSHGIAPAKLVNGPGTAADVVNAYEIVYSFSKDGPYTADIPRRTEEGSYTVYIRATRPDYGTLETTALLTITPKQPIPKTGDGNDPLLWAALMAACCLGLFAVDRTMPGRSKRR